MGMCKSEDMGVCAFSLFCMGKKRKRMKTEEKCTSEEIVELYWEQNANKKRPFRKVVEFKESSGCDEEFSVMSYNILCPDYVVEFHHLYKKCPVESLDESVRRMIVLKEMIHFKPDVVCLQEITEAWFEFFQENLAEENYGCKFTKKTQNKPDGCATFYKKDVFTLHAFDVIKFEEVYFQNDKPRPNIAQMVCLQSVRDQGKRVAVGNTHLIYNPKRQDVRLLHIHEFSKKHLEFREMHGASSGILCGDLNDNPSSHCCRYLSGQTIKYWSDAVIFKPNVKWNSAYRLINEEHRHTSFNHTGEVTDYIWFDGNLNLTEALGTHYKHLSPVPSEIIPSDHLPVMAKFKH